MTSVLITDILVCDVAESCKVRRAQLHIVGG